MTTPESISQAPAPAVGDLLREAAQTIRAIVAGGSERARMQRDALIAFSVRVASAAIIYLSQIVLARWMGSFEYGVYVSVWTWVLVLGGMSHLGLNMGVIRLLPGYKETGNVAPAARPDERQQTDRVRTRHGDRGAGAGRHPPVRLGNRIRPTSCRSISRSPACRCTP